MVVFAFSIPEDVYRIQSADRLDPPLYLERQSNGPGEIKLAVSNAANTNQQWRILYHDDGTYRIVNAKTYEGLGLLAWQEKDETYFRLWSGGPQQVWTFEPHARAFIIGDPTTASCLEIQPNNGVVSHVRTNTISQRWILDTLEPDVPKTEKMQSDDAKSNSYQPDNVKDDSAGQWKQPPLSFNESHSAPALPALPPSVTPQIPIPAPNLAPTQVLANGRYDIINVATGHLYYPGVHPNPLDYALVLMRMKGDSLPVFPRGQLRTIPVPPLVQSTHTASLGAFPAPVSLWDADYDLIMCHDEHRRCMLIPATSPGSFLLVEMGTDYGTAYTASASKESLSDRDNPATLTNYLSSETNGQDKYQQWRFVPV